jgi:hypothetical protein
MMRFIALALTMALLNCSLAFSQSGRQGDETFRVKLFVPAGSDWQSRDVMLSFEQDRIVLRPMKEDINAEVFKYSEIKSVEYSHAKTRRKTSVAKGIAMNIFALPGLFKKVESHWLTVHSGGNQTFLNLDKGNYKAVVAAFEANTRLKVATAADSR